MYAVAKYKGGKPVNKDGDILIVKNKKEKIAFSTIDEICTFMSSNIDDIDVYFLIQILEKTKNLEDFNILLKAGVNVGLFSVFYEGNSYATEYDLAYYIGKMSKKLDVENFVSLREELENDKYKDKVNKKYRKILLEKYKSESRQVKVLAEKLFKNLGIEVLLKPDSSKLISKEGLAVFGEEYIYEIFKHGIYTDSFPDPSLVLKNGELFKKFQAFRQQNVPQKSIGYVNIENAVKEFNQNFDLIEDCFKGELSEEEKLIFIKVLSDKYADINTKAELNSYTTQRTEYIEKLIKTDVESGIIYLLTGLDKDEYEKKKKLYFNDEQLSVSVNDFSEELQTQIMLIKQATSLVDFLIKITSKNESQLLPILTKNLEQEFTTEGSFVARIRNSLDGFEENLRAFYGQELQDSLSKVELPEPKKENGVDVIRLRGEEFKLLVHGLNAYGGGSSVYQNEEVGQTYVCTSLISNNHLNRASAQIYYGFKNIPQDSLAIEGPTDINSEADENSYDITASERVKFTKTQKILEESRENNGFNEIVLYRAGIKPDYIVAFGGISKRDIKEAKRLNIPIVLIKEEIYRETEEKTEVEKEPIVEEKTEIEDISKIETAGESIRSLAEAIIAKASENCTAQQQEAIMKEITNEYKLSVGKGITTGGK